MRGTIANMKIVVIATSRVPSSTANSIQALKASAALAGLGHETLLLVPGRVPAESDWPSLAAFYGLAHRIEVRWLAARSRRWFTWKAARLARRLRADLLYTWVLQSAVFGLLLGLPVVLELHDLPTGRFGPLWMRAFLKLPGRKRLALITHALRRELEKEYGALPDRQVVIAPNGVEPERFADLPAPPQARARLNLPEAPTVLCAGHLYAGRGADLFLALARALPQARFLWLGGRKEDVAAWRARAEAAGLPNVRFAGFVPNQDLPLWLAAADVLLMPYGRVIGISTGVGRSADVASPMKMFEYLAAGRAILTSDLPVLREVLCEENAVFCPPEDVPAWERALRALLGDPAWRERLGARARQGARAYSWTARAQAIVAGV